MVISLSQQHQPTLQPTAAMANSTPRRPSEAFEKILSMRQCATVERRCLQQQVDSLRAELKVADQRICAGEQFENLCFGFYCGPKRDYFSATSKAARTYRTSLCHRLSSAEKTLSEHPRICRCQDCFAKVCTYCRPCTSTQFRISFYLLLTITQPTVAYVCYLLIPGISHRG